MAQISKEWQEYQAKITKRRVALVVLDAVTRFDKNEQNREPYYNLNDLAGSPHWGDEVEHAELLKKLAEVSNEP